MKLKEFIKQVIRESLNLNDIDPDALQLIDIISTNPKAFSNYKVMLKDKYGIDYDSLDNDDEFIENATLDNIKLKEDFMGFDKYIEYAKKIFRLRKIGGHEPNDINKSLPSERVIELGKILNFKVKVKEYNGEGNYASHNLSDTITIPREVDVNTLIHEIGHHFDHYYSNGYNGVANTITHAISPYYISKTDEVFAENFKYYFTNPSFLKKYLPEVYSELDKKIPNNYKVELRKLL